MSPNERYEHIHWLGSRVSDLRYKIYDKLNKEVIAHTGTYKQAQLIVSALNTTSEKVNETESGLGNLET